jgi:outer membrane protein TolC
MLHALTLFLAAAAAPAAQEPLTLREAAALAGSSAPAVERARAEADRAKARESAARSRLGPSLALEAGFLTSDDPVDAFALALKQERFSAVDFFASDPNHPGWTRDWNGSLAAAWTVDLFGSARGAAKAAGGAFQASEKEARRVRDASALQAILAFAEARRAQESGAVLSEREADARRDVDVAVTLEQQGVSTSADPARARAALAEVHAEEAAERGALEGARAALASWIGAEAAARPLAALPEARPVPAGAAGERDDVVAARLSARAARDAEKGVSASRWPTLTIGAHYELHAPNPAERWGDSAAAFGAIRVPLFSSGAVNSKVAEARAASLSAEASALETSRFAEKEIASARAALAASGARLEAYTEAESAARLAREIQQARYEEGAAKLIDLLEARASELKARLGVVAAKSDRAAAEANLRLASGLPPEGEENP